MSDLRRRTFSGLRWTFLNAFGEKVLSFGTTMILARILDPVHFGLYALAFIAIDSFGIFKNLGMDAAIVQRKDRVEEAADTALIVLPLVGLLLFGLLYWSAPTIAVWMGNPEVGAPIQGLGVVLILMSLGNVPGALMQKWMRFHVRTIGNLCGMVAYAVIAVVLSLKGFGVWSLVWAYLTRWVISIPIQWVLLGWKPKWRFNPQLFKEMFRFSKYVLGAWTIGFLAANVDRVVIGRWMGATQLGYYTLCLGLANLVTSQLSVRLYQVAFPAFSEVQDNPERLKGGFLKLLKYLLICAAPLSLMFICIPRDLLFVFYGERWVVAAPVLQVLAVAGLLQAVRVGVDPILMGCGRSRAVFALNILQFVLLAVTAYFLAQSQQLALAACAVVISSATACGLGMTLVARQIRLSWREIGSTLSAGTISLGLLLLTVLVMQSLRIYLFESPEMSLFWLLIIAGSGALVYGGAIIRFDRAMAQELGEILKWRQPRAAGGT